jgi:hypothetical protein
MQVIGISKLQALAEAKPKLAPALRAVAARLANLNPADVAALTANSRRAPDAGDADLRFPESGFSVSIRYNAYADILLIVNAASTGVTT